MNSEHKNKILITGTGRCGTSYLSAFLAECGLDFPHESWGKHGAVDWREAINSDFSGPIIHVVRHPLSCIASLGTFKKEWAWRKIYQATPASAEQPLLQNCMLFWLHWNQIIEARALYRFQIETFNREDLQSISDLVGIDCPDTWPTLPLTINSRKSDSQHFGALNWETLYDQDRSLAEAIKRKMASYGYD